MSVIKGLQNAEDTNMEMIDSDEDNQGGGMADGENAVGRMDTAAAAAASNEAEAVHQAAAAAAAADDENDNEQGGNVEMEEKGDNMGGGESDLFRWC